MSGYRRRTMMSINKKSPQEDTPVEDGLIFWLDGKDVDSSSSYWRSSTLVNSLIPNFRLQYSSTNTVKNQGKCMTITGSGKNAGASEQTGEGSSTGGGRLQPNIFYTLGNTYTHNFSFDVFFNVSTLPSSSITEHRIASGGNTYGDGSYRYALVCLNDKRIRFGQNINGTWRWAYFDTPITLGYHHIVINVDCTNNTCTAFLDGTINGTGSYSYGCPVSISNNSIGLARYHGLQNTSTDDASVIGDFYSLTYYNRILTDAEVKQNYEFYKNRYIE